MRKFSQDEKLRQQMGIKAREWVKRICPPSREIINKVLNLYGIALLESMNWAV